MKVVYLLLKLYFLREEVFIFFECNSDDFNFIFINCRMDAFLIDNPGQGKSRITKYVFLTLSLLLLCGSVISLIVWTVSIAAFQRTLSDSIGDSNKAVKEIEQLKYVLKSKFSVISEYSKNMYSHLDNITNLIVTNKGSNQNLDNIEERLKDMFLVMLNNDILLNNRSLFKYKLDTETDLNELKNEIHNIKNIVLRLEDENTVTRNITNENIEDLIESTEFLREQIKDVKGVLNERSNISMNNDIRLSELNNRVNNITNEINDLKNAIKYPDKKGM